MLAGQQELGGEGSSAAEQPHLGCFEEQFHRKSHGSVEILHLHLSVDAWGSGIAIHTLTVMSHLIFTHGANRRQLRDNDWEEI